MFNPRKYIRTGSAKRRSVLPHSHHHHPNMSNLITVSSAKEASGRTKSPQDNATFLESGKNLRFQSYSSREGTNNYSHSVATITKTKRPRHRSSDQDGGRPYRAHYHGMQGSDKQPEIVHYEDLKRIKFQLPHVFDTAVASEKSATNIRRLFTYLLQNIQEGDTNLTESTPKNHPIYLYGKKYKKKLLKRLTKSDKLKKDRSVETSSTSVNQISDRLYDPFAMDHANEHPTSSCAHSISDLQTTSSYASSIDNLFQDTQNHLRNNTPIPQDDDEDDIAEYFVSLLQESPMLEHFRSLQTQTQTAALDSIQVQLDQLDPSEVPGQITRSDQTETATQFYTYPNDQTIKLDSTQIQHPISIPEPQQHSGIPAAESLEQHSTNAFKLLPINTNTPPESSQVCEKIPEKITPEITLDVPVEKMNSISAHHPAKIRLNQPKKRKNKRRRLSRVKAQTSSGENSAVISIVKRRKVHQMNSKSADQLNLRHSLPTASLSLCRLRKSENVTTQEILKSSWQPHDGFEVILKPKSHLLREEEEQQYDPTQKALAEQCYWVMNCFNMCCPRPFICPPICCSPCPPQAQQQQQQCRWSFECTPSNHLTGCGNNDHNCSNNGMNHNNGNNCSNNGMNNCSNANNSGHPYQSSGRSNCGEINICNPRKFPILSPSHLSPPKFCPRSPSITPPRRSSGGFGSSPTPSDTSSSRATYLSDYSSPIPPRLPPKPMDRYPAPHSYCCSSSMMPPQSVPIPVPYPVPCYAPPPPCFMPQPFFFPFCPQPPAAAPPTRSGHGARSSCEVNRSTAKGFPNPSGTGFPSHSGIGFPSHSGGMCCPTPIAFCCPFNPSQAGGNVAGLPKENSCEMGKPCKRAKRRAKRRNGKRSSCSCCCKC